MLGGLISEFYPSFIYNGESQISLIGNTVLAASLHFALSSCQPLFFCGFADEGEVGAQSCDDYLAGVWGRRKLLWPLECWGGGRRERYGHLLTCPPLAYH